MARRPRSLFELTPVSDADASRLTDPTNESSAHQPVSDIGPDELKSERRLKKGELPESSDAQQHGRLYQTIAIGWRRALPKALTCFSHFYNFTLTLRC